MARNVSRLGGAWGDDTRPRLGRALDTRLRPEEHRVWGAGGQNPLHCSLGNNLSEWLWDVWPIPIWRLLR